jgi:hypothetical protein
LNETRISDGNKERERDKGNLDELMTDKETKLQKN